MNSSRKIADNEYKQILLKIMDAVDLFCKENEIDYFMLGGTLLGSVRHKGFIPWDDDIDIGIKRDDYVRFCEYFNKNRADSLRLICLQNNEHYYMASAKVIDTKTSLIENCYQAIEIGVYIDIFPLDYISEKNKSKAEKLLTRASLKDKLATLKSMTISKNRKWWKNALIVLGKVFCLGSMHTIASDFEKRVISVSGDNSDQYVANMYGVWGKKEIAKAEDFSSVVLLAFEGRKYMAPCGYDDYLKGVYGDYMKLPPVEKRVSHHEFSAEWKD